MMRIPLFIPLLMCISIVNVISFKIIISYFIHFFKINSGGFIRFFKVNLVVLVRFFRIIEAILSVSSRFYYFHYNLSQKIFLYQHNPTQKNNTPSAGLPQNRTCYLFPVYIPFLIFPKIFN